jgi:hypothetical protein
MNGLTPGMDFLGELIATSLLIDSFETLSHFAANDLLSQNTKISSCLTVDSNACPRGTPVVH